ncbi:Hypothetical protein D9617_6g093040 [Elsinoe fawcettii]|nr:Hypothetical protein D9617_6g093040 [Elsinoe fawcettii]
MRRPLRSSTGGPGGASAATVQASLTNSSLIYEDELKKWLATGHIELQKCLKESDPPRVLSDDILNDIEQLCIDELDMCLDEVYPNKTAVSNKTVVHSKTAVPSETAVLKQAVSASSRNRTIRTSLPRPYQPYKDNIDWIHPKTAVESISLVGMTVLTNEDIGATDIDSSDPDWEITSELMYGKDDPTDFD